MTGPGTLLKSCALGFLCILVGTPALVGQTVLPTATALRAYDKGFREPLRLATDGSGHLYVVDSRMGLITIRDESGHLLEIKRGFSRPLGVAVDASGRIFVCEAGRGRVSIFTPGWVPSGALGQGNGEFQMPNHIQVQPNGLVYVVDSAANLVKIYGTDNQLLRTFGGSGRLDGQFNFPTGIAVTPAGEIFVSDQGNERIQVFNSDGGFLRKFGGLLGMTGSNTTFGRVQGLLADGSGRIFLADSFRGVVTVVDATGVILGNIGTFGSEPGQLMGSASLALDRNNRLFVATPSNTRVEIFGLDTFTDPQLLSANLTVSPYELLRYEPRHPVDLERSVSLGPVRPHTAGRVPGMTQRVPELRAAGRGPQWDQRGVTVDESGPGDSRRLQSTPSVRNPHAILAQPDLMSVLIKIPGVDPSSIQGGSLRANGISAVPVAGAFIGDFDGDGSFEFRAWFDKKSLVTKLPDGDGFLVVSGRLADGRAFESIADVRVINLGGGAQ